MACKPVSLRDTLYEKRKKQFGSSRWRCKACYMHPKQKRVSRCKYKMPVRPPAAEREAQRKAKKSVCGA